VNFDKFLTDLNVLIIYTKNSTWFFSFVLVKLIDTWHLYVVNERSIQTNKIL